MSESSTQSSNRGVHFGETDGDMLNRLDKIDTEISSRVMQVRETLTGIVRERAVLEGFGKEVSGLKKRVSGGSADLEKDELERVAELECLLTPPASPFVDKEDQTESTDGREETMVEGGQDTGIRSMEDGISSHVEDGQKSSLTREDTIPGPTDQKTCSKTDEDLKTSTRVEPREESALDEECFGIPKPVTPNLVCAPQIARTWSHLSTVPPRFQETFAPVHRFRPADSEPRTTPVLWKPPRSQASSKSLRIAPAPGITQMVTRDLSRENIMKELEYPTATPGTLSHLHTRQKLPLLGVLPPENIPQRIHNQGIRQYDNISAPQYYTCNSSPNQSPPKYWKEKERKGEVEFKK